MRLMDAATGMLRALPAETAHRAGVLALRSGAFSPRSAPDDPRLAVTLPNSGLRLTNPLGLAAGFDKNAEVFGPMLAFGFGFVECGTVTPLPQAGNPRPRLFRLTEDRAVINRMGFNNEGLEVFAARLAEQPSRRGPVGANVGANKDSADRIGDYVTGLRRVWPLCDYATINISSPNTPGLRGLQDRGALEDLLGRVAEAVLVLMETYGRRPLFLKVAPDLDDRAVIDIAETVLSSPVLTGLIVSNTTIDRPSALRDPKRGEAGGLSGEPLMDRSTECLRSFSVILSGRLDLVGVGGISNARDVVRKLSAGANAVQLYSALVFEGPGLVSRIKSDLVRLMEAEGVDTLAALSGA